jgi:GxxExxY protein
MLMPPRIHSPKNANVLSPSEEKSRIVTNSHECFSDVLLHGPLVYSIVGAAMEVIRGLKAGLHEKPYENAMIVELRLRKHVIDQQKRFEVRYKGEYVGEFIPDLIVDDSVIVDAKVIDRITNIERGQMLNYLRITGLRVGLIINFRHSKLEWERIIL